MFRILALETSTERCSVALAEGASIRSLCRSAGQKHSEWLLPMIDELMSQAGRNTTELDAIAFGAGPGSFTGLRIACGVAQGLAFSADCKVVPVCSLEAMAEATEGENVLVCMDARMGQLYVGAFSRRTAGWQTLLPPLLCDPDDLPELPVKQWLGCGSGFARYPEIMDGPYGEFVVEVKENLLPGAREVLTLAARQLAAGGGVDSVAAAPVYVRNKVALTMAEQG